MLFNMSTYEPDAEALAADSEDYSTELLRSRSYAPAAHVATHGYRDIDSGVSLDATNVDFDALLNDVEEHEF